MTTLSSFKRECNYCKKIMDVNDSISIKRGEIHICKMCAKDIVIKYEERK